MRYGFELPVRGASVLRRERARAYYAPVTLLTLPVIWLACVLLGYAAIYQHSYYYKPVVAPLPRRHH
jgi:hypothetical protein